MKKFFIILLIVTVGQLKASNTGSFIMGSLVTGFCLVPVFDNFWYSPQRNNEGFYISGGLDPKILLTESEIDFRVKAFYHISKVEPFIIYENYNNIYYNSLSLGLDFMIINRKLGLLIGPETSTIWNQNKTVQSIGVNIESRLLLFNRFSVSIIGNLKSRPELTGKNMVPSAYIHLNYLIHGKGLRRTIRHT